MLELRNPPVKRTNSLCNKQKQHRSLAAHFVVLSQRKQLFSRCPPLVERPCTSHTKKFLSFSSIKKPPARPSRQSSTVSSKGLELFVCWKATHQVPQDCKVFILKGNYPALRAALLARGWYENTDTKSPHFDLL